MTCEKEIAKIPFAPLPDLIKSLRYEPEMWTLDGPIEFAASEIGVRGSPTIVYQMGTPPLPEPGEKINTRESGVSATLEFVFKKAEDAGVLQTMLGGAR
jgi:hypothetical protein